MGDFWERLLLAILAFMLGFWISFLAAHAYFANDCEQIGFTRINGTVYQCSIAGEKE